MTTKERSFLPPKHLRPESVDWINSVIDAFEFNPHQHVLLVKAAEALDRAEDAREALATHGTTYTDRYGAPRARPEIAIERDSRIAFARLVRELGLTDFQESRPPALPGNR